MAGGAGGVYVTPEQVREAAARLADDAAARCRDLGEEVADEWLTDLASDIREMVVATKTEPPHPGG